MSARNIRPGDEKPQRRYEPPAVSWEEQIEVRANLAIGCGTKPGQTPDCNASPQS